MPPEQWKGAENVVQASDLYSLGATLFCLLTGSPPFGRGLRAQQLYSKHMRQAPPHLPGSLPEGLDEVIQRLLAKKPTERGSIASNREELRALLEDTRPARKQAENRRIAPSVSPAWSPQTNISPQDRLDTEVGNVSLFRAGWQLGCAIGATVTGRISSNNTAIRSEPWSEVRRLSGEFLSALGRWFASFARPHRHPIRVLITLVLIALLLRLLGVW
jgi:serine/threonine protein kinase